MGIQLLLVCWLRPTTALSADEQSDTHVLYNWYTRKCALKVWITLTHTTGHTYSAYPWHQLCIAIGTHSNVVISISQSTKHRVTLFSYVAYCPESSAHRNVHHSLTGRYLLQKYWFSQYAQRKRMFFLRKRIQPFIYR